MEDCRKKELKKKVAECLKTQIENFFYDPTDYLDDLKDYELKYIKDELLLKVAISDRVIVTIN